jgi:hypothetical protein
LFAQFSPAWNSSIFDREVTFDTFHAHDLAGDLSGPVPLSGFVDEAD